MFVGCKRWEENWQFSEEKSKEDYEEKTKKQTAWAEAEGRSVPKRK